jgi:hypothetical protein
MVYVLTLLFIARFIYLKGRERGLRRLHGAAESVKHHQQPVVESAP